VLDVLVAPTLLGQKLGDAAGSRGWWRQTKRERLDENIDAASVDLTLEVAVANITIQGDT
jgi:hypothetical protein